MASRAASGGTDYTTCEADRPFDYAKCAVEDKQNAMRIAWENRDTLWGGEPSASLLAETCGVARGTAIEFLKERANEVRLVQTIPVEPTNTAPSVPARPVRKIVGKDGREYKMPTMPTRPAEPPKPPKPICAKS